jgi:O-antigen/teichoic acid export membrane protein
MIAALVRKLPVAARGITLLLNAVLAVVLGRIFGAEASGEFFLAFAAVNLAGMIGRLGSDGWAIKVLPSLAHDGRSSQFWLELHALRRICLRGSVGVALIAFLGGITLLALFPAADVGPHLMVLSVSIPFACAAILESAALRSAGRISKGAFAETGLSQGLTIVSILVISLVIDAPPIAISIAYTLSAILTAVLARTWTRSAVPTSEEAVGPLSSLGNFRSMVFIMGSSVLFFLLASSPLFALGIAGSAREVGLYNAAARSSTLISLIPALQTIYLIPRVARAFSSGDIDDVNAQLRRAARQASALALASAVLMLVFSEPITRIFGDDFAGSQPTLIALVVGQALVVMVGNVNPLMAITGLERTSLHVAIAVVVIGVPLMLVGAALIGALGVALAFTASTLAYSVWSAVLLRSRLGIRCYVN